MAHESTSDYILRLEKENFELQAKIAGLEEQNDKLDEERRKLLSQLPQDMQNCTIVFEECPRGHGSLRATNWVKHPCPRCELIDVRAAKWPISSIDERVGDLTGRMQKIEQTMSLLRQLLDAARLTSKPTPTNIPPEPKAATPLATDPATTGVLILDQERDPVQGTPAEPTGVNVGNGPYPDNLYEPVKECVCYTDVNGNITARRQVCPIHGSQERKG